MLSIWHDQLSEEEQEKKAKDGGRRSIDFLKETSRFKNIYDKALLPDGLVSIGWRSFWKLNITEIILSSNLKKIGRSTFGSTKIKNIKIPNSIIQIDSFAFASNPIQEISFDKDAKPEIFIDIDNETSVSSFKAERDTQYMIVKLPIRFKSWTDPNKDNYKIFQIPSDEDVEKNQKKVCFQYFRDNDSVSEGDKVNCSKILTKQ